MRNLKFDYDEGGTAESGPRRNEGAHPHAAGQLAYRRAEARRESGLVRQARRRGREARGQAAHDRREVSPSLALDTKAETLAPTTLDLKLGELPVKVDVQGEKLFGAYVVSGKIQVQKTSPRGS